MTRSDSNHLTLTVSMPVPPWLVIVAAVLVIGVFSLGRGQPQRSRAVRSLITAWRQRK